MRPEVSEIPESKPEVEIPHIVNLDDHCYDQFLPTPFSNKGTTEDDAISVEQYSEDRDLNIAVMSSLNSSKEANFSESKPEVAQIVNLDYYHDRFLGIPLSNKGTGENNAISVEQYGEDRDLNIAIMASLKSNKEANFIDPSQDKFYYYDDEDDDIKVLDFLPEVNPFRKQKDPAFIESVAEKGQSSNSLTQPDSVCQICVEPMILENSFLIKGCTHAYCTECMVKYVDSKLQENITKICCPVPDCKGALEPEDCRPVLPENMFDRWGNALCEALILGSQKFYCPFKDCSAMLIDDGEEVIRESECPNCRRMFCAQCKVPWHSQISCEEYKMLHKDERERDDILLMTLAKNNNWRRCPKCRIFVEKIEGCRYMKCRCGTQFCYSCGSTDLNPETHYCYKCKGIW
uniref:RBR-type E3 ubiquitin transferase n=1 Tax=Salix viminalis TaxID=40686 RepID=A0A6N2L0F1_SALVM